MHVNARDIKRLSVVAHVASTPLRHFPPQKKYFISQSALLLLCSLPAQNLQPTPCLEPTTEPLKRQPNSWACECTGHPNNWTYPRWPSLDLLGPGLGGRRPGRGQEGGRARGGSEYEDRAGWGEQIRGGNLRRKWGWGRGKDRGRAPRIPLHIPSLPSCQVRRNTSCSETKILTIESGCGDPLMARCASRPASSPALL